MVWTPPSPSQDFGVRVKQAASEMAFGRQVTVRDVDQDRYGRTVGEVILPNGGSLTDVLAHLHVI